jgi:aminoglycoside phosphotransferase (APT) family kinase protein
MPVPQVLFHDATRRLIENEYYLMEFINGIPLNVIRPSLSTSEIGEIEYRVGVYLRQMNGIRGGSFGYFPPAYPRFSSWREAFDYMLRGVIADGQDRNVELPLSYEQLYALSQTMYASLDEVDTPWLVHWDLWDGNIFIDPDSRNIIGLIDFERALWGDPLMEVSFWGTPPESRFWQGYGREMLNNRAARERRRLYNIYWFSIMVIEGYYRKYPTNEIEAWSRAQLVKALDGFE